ncbi:Protein RALF-like 33 [Hibiscus syriacus]|uniref:Protein RALF-like 33 n=1 Tax=Hibiscus syriacus TaxID=106335 RepID=A0A6A2Y8E5_HIBSY|nr:rapid alkalinization factor-like [Hibiscus syriacus]KAE8678185.1 Protein RALF-like 33 [Hibiscus syriacus]
MEALNCKLLLICATLIAAAVEITVDASGDHHQHQTLEWIPNRSQCKGSVDECLADEEFDLDSESSRRILATTRYISYGALQRNTVPCSRRGASYYNCQPGAQANPYNRGCSRITRCRG